MAKRMLADVLWEAANVWLYPGMGNHGEATVSCYAISLACNHNSGPALDFVEALGCNCGALQFWDFPSGKKRQGVRYMWLLLAMHVAEDEGLTV